MSDPKLTLTQRALRPIINFLVETWFPTGAFYGNRYLSVFEEIDEGHGVVGYAAAQYLQATLVAANMDKLKVDMYDCTYNGVPSGDYRLVVERVNGKE